MNTLWGLFIAVVIVWSISALVIWIVGKLRIGLLLDGFHHALFVAFVIALIAGILHPKN